MGFGAPLAAREADGVVQIARGKASPAVPVAQRSVRLERRLPVERARATAQRTLARVQSAGRRYLHHRAWLI